jgi:aminopeptidase N
MWLHEGFGTYMQALYAEERGGQAALGRFMTRIRGELANQRPVAPRETRDTQAIYFGERGESDSDIYNKGAWVLHTLRWHMGDSAFFELLRRFAYPDPEEIELSATQVRFADTEELRALAEELCGEDLGWFFEVYLRQSELPRLAVAQAGDELSVTWSVPLDVPFPLDVPVAVDGRTLRVEVDASGRGRTHAGHRFRADPDGWLLKAE